MRVVQIMGEGCWEGISGIDLLYITGDEDGGGGLKGRRSGRDGDRGRGCRWKCRGKGKANGIDKRRRRERENGDGARKIVFLSR